GECTLSAVRPVFCQGRGPRIPHGGTRRERSGWITGGSAPGAVRFQERLEWDRDCTLGAVLGIKANHLSRRQPPNRIRNVRPRKAARQELFDLITTLSTAS